MGSGDERLRRNLIAEDAEHAEGGGGFFTLAKPPRSGGLASGIVSLGRADGRRVPRDATAGAGILDAEGAPAVLLGVSVAR